MMKITPIEIRQKTFDKQFRGYDIDEVDAFLHSISILWENLYNDLELMDKKNYKLKSEVARLHLLENTLIKTIESSETTAENIIRNAEEQAKNIIDKANLEAEKLISTSKKELDKLDSEIITRKTEHNSMSENLLSLAKNIIDKYEK